MILFSSGTGTISAAIETAHKSSKGIRFEKGILLFLVYIMINFIPLYLVDTKVLKQRGHSAAAISCVAGLAMTVPSLMAESDSSYLQYVNESTAQLAFVVVLSAIVTPWLVRKVALNNSSKKILLDVEI